MTNDSTYEGPTMEEIDELNREPETDCFTLDNTDGYTLTQLAELNRRYVAALLTDLDPANQANKSCQDYVAEQVLANFDNELRAGSHDRT